MDKVRDGILIVFYGCGGLIILSFLLISFFIRKDDPTKPVLFAENLRKRHPHLEHK